jgi:hypothetical protein
MIRIYADFDSKDDQGRVWLDTVGSLRDIEIHRGSLSEGTRVVLYVPDDFEVEAVLTFDKAWRGIPDLSTIRYFDAS